MAQRVGDGDGHEHEHHHYEHEHGHGHGHTRCSNSIHVFAQRVEAML